MMSQHQGLDRLTCHSAPRSSELASPERTPLGLRTTMDGRLVLLSAPLLCENSSKVKCVGEKSGIPTRREGPPARPPLEAAEQSASDPPGKLTSGCIRAGWGASNQDAEAASV